MNKLDFTIVTPTLNSEFTIKKTLDSVHTQLNCTFDHLIIDGMSSDKTLNVIKASGFAVRIISELDFGIFDAMNKGILNSRGKIIGILNSDDWYLDGTLERVLEAFESNDVDIVIGGVDVYENGVYKYTRVHTPEELYENMISHPSVFVRKEVYEQIGRFDLEYKIAADYDFLLRAFSRGFKFLELQKSLAAYSLNGYSDSPKSRIRSIFETEIIRYKNLRISKFKATARVMNYALKTLIKRNSRIEMFMEILSCLKWFVQDIWKEDNK